MATPAGPDAPPRAFPLEGGLWRSEGGNMTGLVVVDKFSDTASTASMSRESYSAYSEYSDESSREEEEEDGASTTGSESYESPSSGKRWKRRVKKAEEAVTRRNPWKEPKKAKRDLKERSAELAAERRECRALEMTLAETKLLLANAKEEKDDCLARAQEANDERDLTKATAENEIYQLMHLLKESEAKRKELEAKLLQQQQAEEQPRKEASGRRRSVRGSTKFRSGIDFASRRWRFGRHGGNRNPEQNPVVPLDCIGEQ